jgi:hypothetical protein
VRRQPQPLPLRRATASLEQDDVTESSGGISERLHYDWSDPNRVVLTTTDSNVWGGRSGHTHTPRAGQLRILGAG